MVDRCTSSTAPPSSPHPSSPLRCSQLTFRNPLSFSFTTRSKTGAAHRHPATHKWNKMNSALADYPALQRKGATTAADDIDDGDWFKPYREMAHRSLGIAAEVGKEEGEGKGVVVYLDRNRAVRFLPLGKFALSLHSADISSLVLNRRKLPVYLNQTMPPSSPPFVPFPPSPKSTSPSCPTSSSTSGSPFSLVPRCSWECITKGTSGR